MKKVILLGFIAMFQFLISNAQTGCPQINAGNDVTLSCTQTCTNLTANFFDVGATTNYTVASIPYNPPYPFTGGTQIFLNVDDIWSNVINLPFSFCFYGNTYNQILIGTNGVLTFDVSLANTRCEYSFSAPIPTPGPPPTGIYNNSINGAYHDIDPAFAPLFQTNPANINYAVLGTAPCRTFVVNFSTVPHYQTLFSNCFNLRTTQQIVLYETTNAIDVYIQNKPVCSAWNGGNAVIGIQNANGTQGVTPPGRNTGSWTASNEAWRFTPSGTSIVSVAWYDGTNQIGTGATYSACPSATTTYRAEATYVPCTGGAPIVVSDNVVVTVTGLQAEIDSFRNISCFGLSDGYARATYSNGINPVTFGWSNGSNNLVQNNLAPGTYIFSATDAGGCTRRDTVIISQPTQLTANVPNETLSNCSGTGTASLTASAAGGNAPYTYSWNTTPIQNTQSATNIPAGTYTVTVTDASGCTATDNGMLTVIQANNLVVSLQNTTNVTCNGLANGSLTVAASGGAQPFNYSWNTVPPQIAATANNLNAGSYSVTVTDGGGCTASGTYNITQPTLLTAIIDSFRNVTCFGNSNGFASVAVNGGTAPYTTAWNTNPPQLGNNINNLTAGTYIVGVQDANGCISSDTVAITEAPPLLVNISASQNASCFGVADGSATVSVSGGAIPYTYSWNTNPAQSTATAQNIAAGFYTVSVTDANSCIETDTVTISQPAQIDLFLVTSADASCFGVADGSATVDASGGNLPYQFVWNTNPVQNSAAANNLFAGTYSPSVIDNEGCISTINVTINQPGILLLNTISSNNITCFGAADGAFEIVASGGTPGYSYQWNNASINGTTATQLEAGIYEVTITDNNNCTAEANITISEPALLAAAIFSENITCFGYNDGEINIQTTGGTGNYTYAWNTGNYNSPLVSTLSPAFYSITVTDENGCSDEVSATITQPSQIIVALADSFAIQYGDSVQLTNTISGGTGNYSYLWSPDSFLGCGNCQEPFAFPELTAQYTLTAIDESGCNASATTTVAVIIDKTIYIPNAFSPNGDGENDMFFAFVKDVNRFSMKVFDRWGELIFASEDKNGFWDGTYKGKQLPPSVFVYYAQFEFPDGQKVNKKGTLTLIK